ncbi:MAG: hypothetical protein COB67_02805 [SAR324 cluster bacterium]|uniref:Molybdopterin synthase catalytic subunit n=1 Tax=SAR324 cluster bacterium TaxID=2024889 RepID=A0A2A4T921_9DELT|nr:MAG: hypothetical protein COB67_02805 [SAR324 cluster bacterium]
MFEITEKTIDPNELVAKVDSARAGAISTFIGVTRNFTGDFHVDYLFYEAYHEMAIKMMKRIGEQTLEKFPIEKIAISHRIGRVNIGEASVVIAVSASHRAEAIEACHYAIDTLKELVPIWKKEFMVDGDQKWIANDPKWN